MFEEQVERTPDAVAVVYEGQWLSYAELNTRAISWHGICGAGVGPDQLVGICVERSLEMVVGLLGILKAGGRLRAAGSELSRRATAYMLEDAAPQVLLTQQRLKEKLPVTKAHWLRSMSNGAA